MILLKLWKGNLLYVSITITIFLLRNLLFTSDYLDPTHVTLDSLKIKVDAAEAEEEKSKLEKELQDHLEMADQGYATLRKDCEECHKSWSNVEKIN